MRLQKKLIIFRTVISFQSLLRMFQCLLLNVKSQNPSSFSCKLASQRRVIAISHCCINTDVSQHDLLPYKMLHVCSDLKIFHLKILSKFSYSS